MISHICICSPLSPTRFTPIIRYINERVFTTAEGTIIAHCISCGVLRTFPSKTNHFEPKTSKVEMYEQNRDSFAAIFEPIITRINKYSPGKSILDVGCSTGILMSELAKQGFDVAGIEPNRSAFMQAQKRFGNKVHYGTLTDYQHKQKFDAIIYNHVLEHIPDVLAELNQAASLLNTKGILIIGVPNTHNIIFTLRQKYWESLLPIEHIWHFSAAYLTRLLSRHGFEIIDTSFSDHTRADYPWKKRLYFSVLSGINKLFLTGESVLIVACKTTHSRVAKTEKNRYNISTSGIS